MGRWKRYFTILSIFMHSGGRSRAKYLQKIGYFKSMGENCSLYSYNFGTEPKMISFGDNVHVASGVTFITHDVSFNMLNHMDFNGHYKEKYGEILIGSNVFIGSNSILLYDIHIGNNVIIGAGSIVTKDISDNVVAVGCPCKPIESFENWEKKQESL